MKKLLSEIKIKNLLRKQKDEGKQNKFEICVLLVGELTM